MALEENLTEEQKKQMQYIKWPTPGKTVSEMFVVIVVSAAMAMLIAAGDELGMAIINGIMQLF